MVQEVTRRYLLMMIVLTTNTVNLSPTDIENILREAAALRQQTAEARKWADKLHDVDALLQWIEQAMENYSAPIPKDELMEIYRHLEDAQTVTEQCKREMGGA
jgi:molecular chaperone DnaK (HSP70)